MTLRITLYGSLAALLAAGLWFVADVLVTTDHERLAGIVHAMESTRAGERLERLLELTELTTESMDLVTTDSVQHFSSRGAGKVSSAVRSALASIDSTDAKLVQSHIDVNGDHAKVAMRFRTPNGVSNAVLQLTRHGDRWVASRITVKRG